MRKDLLIASLLLVAPLNAAQADGLTSTGSAIPLVEKFLTELHADPAIKVNVHAKLAIKLSERNGGGWNISDLTLDQFAQYTKGCDGQAWAEKREAQLVTFVLNCPTGAPIPASVHLTDGRVGSVWLGPPIPVAPAVK